MRRILPVREDERASEMEKVRRNIAIIGPKGTISRGFYLISCPRRVAGLPNFERPIAGVRIGAKWPPFRASERRRSPLYDETKFLSLFGVVLNNLQGTAHPLLQMFRESLHGKVGLCFSRSMRENEK